jgi:nucleoside-diphosphate-sugar epimerase
MTDVQTVFHTATLHKPHVATHSKEAFIDTNVTGTLNLLESAADAEVEQFIFTSTTSVFGNALRPPAGTPAAWVTEEVVPEPKNIYGVTKTAAEDLCLLLHRQSALPCIVLRTSRFFPEDDDNRARREQFVDENLKANEFLYRRVDVQDVVDAHLCARREASRIGFGRFIISATSPFEPSDLVALNTDATAVVAARHPEYLSVYEQRGYRMLQRIDRVYVNAAARTELGWEPAWGFPTVLDLLSREAPILSPLAASIGSKGYHDRTFSDGPFPVED